MLILYVWTGVHTRVGEGRKREVGGYSRSLFQRTLRSSTLARSAQPADTQGTMTTMTMVTMMSMTNVESLPLSLPVVDTMVKSRGCRFLLSFSCRASSLSIENHSNRSIDRSLLSKTGGSSCCSSKADYSTDFPFFFFFFSRGCDRSRNFSTTSGGGVSLVLWDEYWSGFGWRRGISRYIGDRWIQREKMERRCGVTFFCRDSRFAGNRVWKFVGETLIAPFTVPLFSFFFFKFENTFFSRMKFFVRVIEKWFYREREIEIKRLILIRGKRLIKGIFRRNFEMHFLENGNWHVEISFPRLSTYTFFDEVCQNHTRSNRFWNKVSANGSSLTSMVIYIANTRNFPTGKLLIQMLWNVATSFAPASIARNRRCSGNSSHPANKILSPNSKRNFPRNCDVNACIV